MNRWNDIRKAKKKYDVESSNLDKKAEKARSILEQIFREFLGNKKDVYLEFAERLEGSGKIRWANKHKKAIRDIEGFYYLLFCVSLPYPTIKFPIGVELSKESEKVNIWSNMLRDKEKYEFALDSDKPELETFMKVLFDNIIDYYESPLKNENLSRDKNIKIGFTIEK